MSRRFNNFDMSTDSAGAAGAEAAGAEAAALLPAGGDGEGAEGAPAMAASLETENLSSSYSSLVIRKLSQVLHVGILVFDRLPADNKEIATKSLHF
jgi:hypothetical protein